MPLSHNLGFLALAVALIPLGTAFTFPCVTALLSRVIAPRERGLYMGMQQTYGGVARIVAPLFFGWSFDTLGVSSPYFFSSGVLLCTILLGFGLDKYARPNRGMAPAAEAPSTGSPASDTEPVEQSKAASSAPAASQ
jgi:MFS family permease